MISIVIPACNGERFLGQTIESVLAQSIADWELIVVNDGSADGTEQAARAYADRDPRIRVISQANAGVGAARNRGLAEAGPASTHIAFLDHDDVWERYALQRLLSALALHPDASAASGLHRIIDASGEPLDGEGCSAGGRARQGVAGRRLREWPSHVPTTLAVLAYDNCIYTPGQVLIRRSALEAVGPFDAALSPCDDWDMWLRLCLWGPITYVDRVVVNWRAHGGNGSTAKERMRRGHLTVRRKLLSSPGLTPTQRCTAVAAARAWAKRMLMMRLGRIGELLTCREVRPALNHIGPLLADCWNYTRGAPVILPLLYPTPYQLYWAARCTASDISEHLDILYELARCCRHVTEFGTRWGISTAALLYARPAVLVSYDNECLPSVSVLADAAQTTGHTRFIFHQEDVLSVSIEETDLLFIDTRHTYTQLKAELSLHARKVRKHLVLHDTTTFGEVGEEPGSRGLWPAVQEFLLEYPEWTLSARLANNNGLTILTRVGVSIASVLPRLTSAVLPVKQES